MAILKDPGHHVLQSSIILAILSRRHFFETFHLLILKCCIVNSCTNCLKSYTLFKLLKRSRD